MTVAAVEHNDRDRGTVLQPPGSAARKAATANTAVRCFVHRLLNHPAVMAAKAPVKDALWTVRGRAVRNPTLADPVRSILFLCHGNICRSPFAALRAAQRFELAGLEVRCASAGIKADQANACPREAREAAEAFGVSLDGHAPLRLTPAMMAEFDLIVVMELDQRRHLQERFGEARGRLVLLSLFDNGAGSGYARYNIADPFGHPRNAFDACYRRIDAALQSLVEIVRSTNSKAGAERLRATQGAV